MWVRAIREDPAAVWRCQLIYLLSNRRIHYLRYFAFLDRFLQDRRHLLRLVCTVLQQINHVLGAPLWAHASRVCRGHIPELSQSGRDEAKVYSILETASNH